MGGLSNSYPEKLEKDKMLEGGLEKKIGEEKIIMKEIKKPKKKYPRTYAITAAQAIQNPHSASNYGRNSKAGAPHEDFLKCFDRYCKEEKATSIIQSIQGAYVSEIELDEFFIKRKKDIYMETARFKRLLAERRKEKIKRMLNESSRAAFHYFWDEISSYKYRKLNLRRLNKKIGVLEPQTPSQNDDPVTGNKDLPQDYLGISIILPHPKQRLVAVAKDVGGKLPRLLLSTGCCTHPNYNETNTRGKKARRRHQYGFCVVETIDEKTYLPRLVSVRNDGAFVDMGIKYLPGKDPKKARTLALILGDWHLPLEDPGAKKASFEMIEYFKPKEIYIHDLLDFQSICHHKWGDSIYWMLLAEKSKERGFEFDKLESELEVGLNFLKELSNIASKSQIYVVPSNHDQFLYTWITKGEHLNDRKNSRLGSSIRGNYFGGNPLKVGLEQIGDIPSNVFFLDLRNDKRPWGYQCGCHGHLGNGGGKGSLNSFKVSYGKGVFAHFHTLEQNGHAISVGTNSIIPLEYQEGRASRSMHGNAVIYESGLVQALPIIHGQWRKK